MAGLSDRLLLCTKDEHTLVCYDCQEQQLLASIRKPGLHINDIVVIDDGRILVECDVCPGHEPENEHDDVALGCNILALRWNDADQTLCDLGFIKPELLSGSEVELVMQLASGQVLVLDEGCLHLLG